jgi:predicted permease
MCLALGASRVRVAAGIAIEGLLLAAAGAALSLPVSQMLFAGLGAFQLPGGIRVDRLDLTIDGRVLAGAVVAGVVSVLLMALVASAFGLRRNLGDALRSHAGATSRMTRRGSRAALFTAQVAVTLVLVTGAGLFARSVVRALSLNPGVDTSRLFRVELPLPDYGYDPAREWAFVDTLRERIAHQPALASVGVSTPGAGYRRFQIDGASIELSRFVSASWIDSQYFDTIGLPISMGRAFTTSDRMGAPPVAIVTASLAKIIAGDGHPIGHRIGYDSISAEVVGVVPDLVLSPAGTQPLRSYMPLAQAPPLPTYPGAPGPDLFVRAARDVADARTALIAAVRDIDPHVRLPSMSTIDDRILDDMAPQRFGATVMGALGAIALLLSVFGTYVLVESMATLRRREMGIRAALGAPGGHLRMLLFSETFRLIGAGLLLGFGLSWLGAGTIRAFLFQVEPFDPLVTLSVAALIVLLAVLVTLRPALAAARVDLAQVLRDE